MNLISKLDALHGPVSAIIICGFTLESTFPLNYPKLDYFIKLGKVGCFSDRKLFRIPEKICVHPRNCDDLMFADKKSTGPEQRMTAEFFKNSEQSDFQAKEQPNLPINPAIVITDQAFNLRLSQD